MKLNEVTQAEEEEEGWWLLKDWKHNIVLFSLFDFVLISLFIYLFIRFIDSHSVVMIINNYYLDYLISFAYCKAPKCIVRAALVD